MAAAAAMRRVWRLPLVCAWIGCGLLMAAAMAFGARLAGARSAQLRPFLTRVWMRGLTALLPLRVRYLGDPADGPALWASNHVSWVDIVVLGARVPLRFLSKSEVARWPVIGWLATAAGTLYLRRGEGVANELDTQIGDALASGQSVVVFAEGTTTDGSRVRTFHGRLLGSALRTGRPVQPVAVAYRRDGQRDLLAPFIADDEFTRHLWRLLGSSTIEVEVRFPEALAAADLNRNQLARRAQSAVVQALELGPDPTAAVASAA